MTGLGKAKSSSPNDLLARSLAAVRAEPDEAGPSDRVRAAALATVLRAAEAPRGSPFNLMHKALHMTMLQKVAAAFVLALGGIVFWAFFTGPGTRVSYGEVAEQIRSARTMTWTQTFQPPGGAEAVSLKLLFRGPGQLRLEGPGEMTTVMDTATHETLLLDKVHKTAVLVEVKQDAAGAPGPAGAPGAADVVNSFRKLADQPAKPIDDRQVGPVRAKGFEVRVGSSPVSMWVAPKTRLPLLVEMPVSAGGVSGRLVLSDITFDANLDEGLFSVEPPAGYEVVKSALSARAMRAPPDVEANVKGLLRIYAAKSHGAFPPALDDWAAFAGAAAADSKDGQLDKESQELMADVGALTGPLIGLQKGTDYDYLPAGAKLGDADKVVFWFRKSGGPGYRAVYGDLHAADVTKEGLPNK